ncbi:uncharacterized protein METZ01_LOCUS159573 [marine metagenome]|uniref:Uncharacterized protein n=1 Tax=marine metagenome TaxID=408172 RepID=A0A382AZ26_9ZZZZ
MLLNRNSFSTTSISTAKTEPWKQNETHFRPRKQHQHTKTKQNVSKSISFCTYRQQSQRTLTHLNERMILTVKN